MDTNMDTNMDAKWHQKLLLSSFAFMGGDSSRAVRAAKKAGSQKRWLLEQRLQASAAGVAVAVPGPGRYAALMAEYAFLIHKVAYCCWGMGALHGCTIDAKEDLAVILKICGSKTFNEMDEALEEMKKAVIAAKEAAVGSGQVAVAGVAIPALAGTIYASLLASNMPAPAIWLAGGAANISTEIGHLFHGPVGDAIQVSSFVSERVGEYLGHKYGIKGGIHIAAATAQTLGHQFGAKLSGKALGTAVPILHHVVGPAICMPLNWKLMGKFAAAADKYYTHKAEVSRT